MKVVADSQAVVWYLSDDSELSERAAEVLEEAESTDGICIAAAGVIDLWYASQKRPGTGIGKQEYELVKARLRNPEANFHILPLGINSIPHAEIVTRTELPDPFDRMIVAAALEHGLELVTSDKRITELGVVPVIW